MTYMKRGAEKKKGIEKKNITAIMGLYFGMVPHYYSEHPQHYSYLFYSETESFMTDSQQENKI
ncbi:hypothetical protein CE91St54_07840 [Hungatella hathewayi]|uniref:Uncharacterized protein n=1 Tax=Hungatella hathewayi TaxID=154046 RepID=A0AA37NAH9_9FIRM|nr:hypothetical protein CE91St55_08350 [Hungatella hathewayi]GKH05676.1 hypothetical protein CE91St54_07840 [Hungatella hathewayi]